MTEDVVFVTIANVTFPLLSGPTEVVEGYQNLNELERGFVDQALRLHVEPTVLWYRALTLYRQAIAGEWDHTGREHPDFGVRVANLQAQLLGLGISTAKSSLDSLLSGYYSSAFAGIRHMLETFVQHVYLIAEPQEYVRWYKPIDDGTRDHKSPGCREMIIKIQASAALANISFPMDLMSRVYDSWALMSKGSHPTGEGIVQTVDETTEVRFVYGATYNRRLCLTGFDHGLFAVCHLLASITAIRQQSSEWERHLESLRQRLSAWRQTVAAELSE